MRRPVTTVSYLVIGLIGLIGCGAKSDRIPVYKTTGKLVRTGASVERLAVTFHPIDPSAPATPVLPSGVVNPDGSFEVTSYNLYDGAPVGEYIVTVGEAPRADSTPKPFPLSSQYLSPKSSPLRARIEAQPLNELAPFDISH